MVYSTYLFLGILTLVGCTSQHSGTEGQNSLPVTVEEKEKFLIDLANYNAGVIQLALGDSMEQNDSIQLYFFKKCVESQPDIETENMAKEFIEAINKDKPKRI